MFYKRIINKNILNKIKNKLSFYFESLKTLFTFVMELQS
jgi:hypothetical protein